MQLFDCLNGFFYLHDIARVETLVLLSAFPHPTCQHSECAIEKSTILCPHTETRCALQKGQVNCVVNCSISAAIYDVFICWILLLKSVFIFRIRTPSVKEKDAKDLDREKRTGSVGAPDEKTKLPLAEEDSRGPTNHLLRVIGRIRRLLTQLTQGGHIEAVGAEQCRENDELVLNRQLVKLQRWQQSVTQNSAEYNEKDVVDVEDIVSFIANHIR